MLSCWEKGHLLFFYLFWIFSLLVVHLYFSTCFGYCPCTSLFFCLFWIFSLYIFIFLLVLDIVLGHLYFSACFGYFPWTSLFFYLFWILSLYIFIFLLVLDIVLGYLYFSTCFGYCPCTSLCFYLFWILSLYIFFFFGLDIFIFLLVLDNVFVHLYFSTCFGDICHVHFMFVVLFWKISIDNKVILTSVVYGIATATFCCNFAATITLQLLTETTTLQQPLWQSLFTFQFWWIAARLQECHLSVMACKIHCLCKHDILWKGRTSQKLKILKQWSKYIKFGGCTFL